MITEGPQEHARRAFGLLNTRLGDASVILPPSFGRHLEMTTELHGLEEAVRWEDASSHIPRSDEESSRSAPSASDEESDDIPF